MFWFDSARYVYWLRKSLPLSLQLWRPVAVAAEARRPQSAPLSQNPTELELECSHVQPIPIMAEELSKNPNRRSHLGCSTSGKAGFSCV